MKKSNGAVCLQSIVMLIDDSPINSRSFQEALLCLNACQVCVFHIVCFRCAQNKMDSSNLSVIFAPNLFHCGDGVEKMNSSTEKRLKHQAAAVQCLIDNAAALGKHFFSSKTL